MGAFDATTKYLVEAHTADWLALAGVPTGGGAPRVVDAELTTIASGRDGGRRPFTSSSSRPGTATWTSGCWRTTSWPADGTGVPVRSVVFLLRPAAGPPGVRGSVRWADPAGSTLSFDYDLIRVWQLPAERLLAGGIGTLPLAPIGAVDRTAVPAVIGRIRDRLDREIPPQQAGELLTATRILMGLRYNQPDVRDLLRGVRHMRESVTYQEIVDEGRVEGERDLLLRQGSHKFGRPPAGTVARLRAVTDVAELERLGVALLDAASWDEWLAAPAARPKPRRRRRTAP